jgi:hypothetical protein
MAFRACAVSRGGTPGDCTPDGEPSFEELLNVEAGEMRLPVPPGGQTLHDLVTGKSADLGLCPTPRARGRRFSRISGAGGWWRTR